MREWDNQKNIFAEMLPFPYHSNQIKHNDTLVRYLMLQGTLDRCDMLTVWFQIEDTASNDKIGRQYDLQSFLPCCLKPFTKIIQKVDPIVLSYIKSTTEEAKSATVQGRFARGRCPPILHYFSTLLCSFFTIIALSSDYKTYNIYFCFQLI